MDEFVLSMVCFTDDIILCGHSTAMVQEMLLELEVGLAAGGFELQTTKLELSGSPDIFPAGDMFSRYRAAEKTF